MARDKGIHPVTSWQFHAAAGVKALDKTSRGIWIAGGGVLYAHIGEDVAETKVGIYPANTHVPIQTDKIGASSTCTDLTIYHQDPHEQIVD